MNACINSAIMPATTLGKKFCELCIIILEITSVNCEIFATTGPKLVKKIGIFSKIS